VFFMLISPDLESSQIGMNSKLGHQLAAEGLKLVDRVCPVDHIASETLRLAHLRLDKWSSIIDSDIIGGWPAIEDCRHQERSPEGALVTSHG